MCVLGVQTYLFQDGQRKYGGIKTFFRWVQAEEEDHHGLRSVRRKKSYNEIENDSSLKIDNGLKDDDVFNDDKSFKNDNALETTTAFPSCMETES